MRRPSGEIFSEDFSTTYFKDLAQTASLKLVAQERLTAGETFTYRTAAYPVVKEAAEKRRFKIEEVELLEQFIESPSAGPTLSRLAMESQLRTGLSNHRP